MKIVVCIKQVPDTKGGVKFNPDGTLDRGAMLTIMNPDDKAGLEAALRLKDQYGAEVTVITMGLPKAEDVLREAMAMGADKGILVTDRVLGGADTWATSQTLAGAIRNLDYDLIITGRQAIDGDTAQAALRMLHMGAAGEQRKANVCHGSAGEYAEVFFLGQMRENEPLPVAIQCILAAGGGQRNGYNLPFDIRMLGQNGIWLPSKGKVRYLDLMRPFSETYGEINERTGRYKWQKLITCAKYYGYEEEGWHDSLADTKATLYCLWKMVEDGSINIGIRK